ncbi:hypothetical protein HMPREF9628_01288 [Peptoanaerobacter stomatis]|uniref:Uncharacterized protein n=1 Tax=Peptoanaerobacter stomatis TaxID=796937 RepID=G9XBC1_9FIRM|nr:pyocin knob domain-containing protein [Peptoanaerobacter stomatis]EHL19772.1 hypothetical protein HMPREF9628_01288 [Peptoanaerobacter stomatis]
MQETDKLKLRKPEYNEYADVMDLNYNMDILDNAVSDKLGKTEKALDSEKLNGLNMLQFSRSYSLSNGETIPRDVLRTTNIANAYIGMINYGTEDGLPCPHSKIIYMPHNTDGYGTQIAIPYESGNYHGVFYRNATGGNWGAWIELLDTRDRNTILTNDANTCFETGKAYYCVYQQTKNLPLGDNIDDGIIIPYMYIKGQYGFQIYMTWNGASIWWRRVINGNWDGWRCIGGGSWNQEILKDSSQVMRWFRWNHYGTNHVIFDASQGLTPDGKSCNNANPDIGWSATYPTLMGFNGVNTYGLRVDCARWSDGAGSVQGFPFRNNNGKLEVLVGGEWLQVGGRQYTVTRLINTNWNDANRNAIESGHVLFEYNGGSGILRSLFANTDYRKTGAIFNVIIDGITIHYDTGNFYYSSDNLQMSMIKVFTNRSNSFGDDSNKFLAIPNELEFKNSIKITVAGYDIVRQVFGLVQTEK